MRRITSTLFTLFLTTLLALTSCKDYSEVKLPDVGKDLDNATYVSVGNSLTAGYQSGALYQEAQKYSFAKLFARQLRDKDFEVPYVSSPGIGERIELVNLRTMETRRNTSQGELLNTNIGRPYSNLGLPGAKLDVYLNQDNMLKSYSAYGILNAAQPGQDMSSIHAAVKELQPDIMTFWLGNNDILDYVTSGGLRPFTNPTEFAQSYGTAVAQIRALNSDPALVLLNIPSVTSIPFATTIGPRLKQTLQPLANIPGIVVQKTFYKENQAIGASENRDPAGLIPKEQLDQPNKSLVLLTAMDFVNLLGASAANPDDQQKMAVIIGYWKQFIVNAGLASEQEAQQMSVDQLEQTLTQMTIGQYAQTFGQTQAATFAANYPGFEFDKPFGFDAQNPFPNQFVLDSNEISITQTVTGIYNNVIANQNAIHVDFNAFQNQVMQQGGYVDPVSGEQLAPVLGSMFSLDGIHPSNKAQGVIANLIIKQVNSELGSEVPLVDIRTIPRGIPVATEDMVALDK